MTPMLHMSVAGDAGSKFTTSGAMNSGVPNRIRRSPEGSNFRAKPKSMILIMLPSRVRHNIFSGCKERVAVLSIFEVIYQEKKVRCPNDYRRSWWKLSFVRILQSFWALRQKPEVGSYDYKLFHVLQLRITTTWECKLHI